MRVLFDRQAQTDYNFFVKHHAAMAKKIVDLIADIQLHPESGLGKPERLRGQRSYLWSRRIDKKNRLVYMVDDDKLVVIQCRNHYADK